MKYAFMELERYTLYAVNLCFNSKVKMTLLAIIYEEKEYWY